MGGVVVSGIVWNEVVGDEGFLHEVVVSGIVGDEVFMDEVVGGEVSDTDVVHSCAENTSLSKLCLASKQLDRCSVKTCFGFHLPSQ